MQALDSLIEVAAQFDVIVLDQWGVLHDGTHPYPGAVAALPKLRSQGTRLAVLSNSGKRAAPNAARIAQMGFDTDQFDQVMTSGEALWLDIQAGRVAYRNVCPITRASGDAEDWAEGLELSLTDLDAAEAILLMGLPDAGPEAAEDLLKAAFARNLPLLCTNPDHASPRANGVTVTSPGALAQTYEKMGGTVRYYGKPHLPVFEALQRALGAKTLLMVGDSLMHDIAGGHSAGWSTAFIRGGLHAASFSEGNWDCTVQDLAIAEAAPLPTYHLAHLG